MNVFVVVHTPHYEEGGTVGACRTVEGAKQLAESHATAYGRGGLTPFDPATIYGIEVQRLVSKGASSDYEILEYELRD